MEMAEQLSLDKSYAALTNAVFQNFMAAVLNPTPFGFKEKQQQKKFYESALKWCDTDQLWFSAFEVYFNYDPGQLKERLKYRINKQIENRGLWL